MPEFEPIGEPVTEAEIAAAEERMGREIPEPYRAFLLEHNGGTPDPPRFVYTRTGGRKGSGWLAFLFGVDVQRSLNLEDVLSTYDDRIPPEFFPVGRDPGGNLLVMGDDGKILYWDHEGEADEDEPPTHDNLYPVADSLDALLDSLEPLE